MNTLPPIDNLDNLDNAEDFINIIQQLLNHDLLVLQLIFMNDNETDQIKCLRNNREQITFYPNLYNAYCAANSLVKKPLTYITNEILRRRNF
jgi:hypothetical protein